MILTFLLCPLSYFWFHLRTPSRSGYQPTCPTQHASIHWPELSYRAPPMAEEPRKQLFSRAPHCGLGKSCRSCSLLVKEEDEHAYGVISWQSLPRSGWEVLLQGIFICPSRQNEAGESTWISDWGWRNCSSQSPWLCAWGFCSLDAAALLWVSPCLPPPQLPSLLPFAREVLLFSPCHQPLPTRSTSSPRMASLVSYVSFPVFLHANTSKSEYMFLFPPSFVFCSCCYKHGDWIGIILSQSRSVLLGQNQRVSFTHTYVHIKLAKSE